jgi:hypothetical protein
VRATRSLVSLGTERMLVEFGRGSWLSKARQQPEKFRAVLAKVRSEGLFATVAAVRSKLAQPIPLGYCHVGHRIALGGDGTVAVEWNSARGAGEGAAFADVGMAALGGGGADAGAQVGVLIEAEMSAMSALLDGSAVEDHMEPKYLENLQASAAAHFAGLRQG